MVCIRSSLRRRVACFIRSLTLFSRWKTLTLPISALLSLPSTLKLFTALDDLVNAREVPRVSNLEVNLKVVTLGDKSAGKTSLIMRFIEGRFKMNSQPTIGALFLCKRGTTEDGFGFKLQVWDTSGDKRFEVSVVCYMCCVIFESLCELPPRRQKRVMPSPTVSYDSKHVYFCIGYPVFLTLTHNPCEHLFTFSLHLSPWRRCTSRRPISSSSVTMSLLERRSLRRTSGRRR